MQQPRVSVCMTTYNHVHYVRQAIDSVLAQKTDFPFELLIGEDDSTDGTREIVRAYAEKYPELIRPFYHDSANKLKINGRITGRRNLANNLRQARGEFVHLLDGDDFWIDTLKLQKQVQFLDDHPEYSGCFHNAIHVDVDGNYLDQLAVGLTRSDFTLADVLRTNPVPTMSGLYRNRFPAELPDWFWKTDMADWPVAIMSSSTGPLHYLPWVMAAYRIHDQGFWSSFRSNQSKALASQIQVWRLLLQTADFGHEALLRWLVNDNFERIIRTERNRGDWTEVMRFVRERRQYLGRWDAFALKYLIRFRLKWLRRSK